MSQIGATLITTCSRGLRDWLGHHRLPITSYVLYFIGLVMLWSPNVYILLFATLLGGFGIGLSVIIVSVYISKTAPPEIRGSLNTLPQFTCSRGMFMSYHIMVFGMSLMKSPSWRLMMGIIYVSSVVYFVLTMLFLPQSPRWLVSKGWMIKAK